MQPISTMRSPPAGDRPVVSVSKTISRMAPLNTRFEAETSEDRIDLATGLLEAARRIDHIIGPLPLLAVGHLAGEDMVEFLFGHSRSGQHSLALQLGSGRYDDH